MVRFLDMCIFLANALLGMFLWVRLVLDSFEYIYTLGELNDIVDSFPEGLEALYKEILDRVCNVGSLQKCGGVPRISTLR